jgi:sugar-specific transcriptional regulator TrmB
LSSEAVSERVIRTLRDLGLTDYEVNSYLALLQHGELSAGEISKRTSIPYSKIYSVLENLERKGWVEIGSGRPKLYYPRAPSEALRAETMRQERRLRELEELIVSELQPLYERREIKERPEIWIIRGEENIAAKVREMITKVERELMIALPLAPRDLLELLGSPLNALMDRRISILFLTTPKALENLPTYIPNLAETRLREEMFGGGMVVDGREAILFLGQDDSTKALLAVWSDHIGLTQIAKIYFQHLWETSKPI